ncbi:MAG: RNA polymerase factor sigma-54 [Bacteroidales bacterium]|nr:RNA polymerase factor sigma-54 [Bacteroidales bacterium]
MKEYLSMEQTQRLAQRLSPRQVLHARVLEMTQPELEEELRRQLDDNPALEAEYAPEAKPEEEAATQEAPEIEADEDPADYGYPSSQGPAEEYTFQIPADAPDLYDSLNAQAGELNVDDEMHDLMTFIIGNLDDNGYLTRTLRAVADDMAVATGREIAMDRMREAFELVRSLDPAGVGAVDLRDCLLLQLDRMRPNSLELRMAREIVDHYFDLLSKKHYERLASSIGLSDQDDMRDALKLIRSLNPKPGSAIELSGTSMRLGHISPDVAVEEDDNGRFTVSVLSRLPQLQIESTFAVDLPLETLQNKRAREAQAFIRSKRDEAEAFISALKNRSMSLLLVTRAIVARQPEFFRTGDQAKLRPMVLKDVSEDTGMDLSSISRATAGKYVAAPTGVYPLKMFFNEAPREDSDTSSHELMQALKEIIEHEDPRRPMSDQALWEVLESKGYKLARRTLTKYREKLGIPVARLRKKL